MKLSTAYRIAQAIQLLKLDGFEDYTSSQLADASGVTTTEPGTKSLPSWGTYR